LGRSVNHRPRTNTAHATPISAASAASRWVAHATWFTADRRAKWQIWASSPRCGSAARPSTSRCAIAAARPLNGGHGRRTSNWPRTNTREVTNLYESAPQSRKPVVTRTLSHLSDTQRQIFDLLQLGRSRAR
jgi:hypothetical protein